MSKIELAIHWLDKDETIRLLRSSLNNVGTYSARNMYLVYGSYVALNVWNYSMDFYALFVYRFYSWNLLTSWKKGCGRLKVFGLFSMIIWLSNLDYTNPVWKCLLKGFTISFGYT